MGLSLSSFKKLMPIGRAGRSEAAAQRQAPPLVPARPRRPPPPRRVEPFEPADRPVVEKDPLRQWMQLERFGRILAEPDAFQGHLEYAVFARRAAAAIDEAFALVPEGWASLAVRIPEEPGAPELDFEVEPFLLARHTVTNAQYQKFVDAGGYDDLDLWPRDLWPHLIDFRDLTGTPGPRYWRHGRHNKLISDHPVVGVCFFEAAAYCKWAGFRLPTDAEWQMAASWRIRSAANTLRRYPWGDALNINACNIWASGIGRTVPVHAYEAGAAPNDVLQLIGNVWEWTEMDFSPADAAGNPIVGDMLMKGIRGGAFDTYFACQATSLFRTGLSSLSRTHNVGFRCAMDLKRPDDAAPVADPGAEPDAEPEGGMP